MAFAIPSRVAVEASKRRRSTGYVTHFEGGCVWVYLQPPADLSFRDRVRMVFRREGEASLGMGGTVIWRAQDRIAVEVDHPVDRAIVRQWSRGLPADVTEFCEPTGDLPRVIEGPLTLEDLRPRSPYDIDTVESQPPQMD